MGLLSGLLSGLIFGAFAIIIGKINNKIHKDGTSEEQNNIDEVSNSSAGYHLDGTFAGTLKEHPVVAPLPDELPPQEAEPIAAIPQTKENASEAVSVVPELPQIKVKKPKQKKNRFCKLCGSLIEPQSKKCTGCGKQYFKIRFPKKYIYPTVSALLIIGLCIALDYQTYQNNQILERKNSDLDFKQSTIDSLRGEIEYLEDEIDKLEDEKMNLSTSLVKARSNLKNSTPTLSGVSRLKELVEAPTEEWWKFELVYITKKGTHYHTKKFCYYASEGAKEEIIIRDALMLGYSPCPVCHPDK